jgi:signal transduction histidine kinase
MEDDPHILAHIVDALPSGLLLFEADGRILRINRKARNILGLDAELRLTSLRDHLPFYLSPLVHMLQNTGEDVQRGELSLYLPVRDEESILGYNLKPFSLDNGTSLKLFIFSDITQVWKDRLALDKIKDELYQSRKLASLGTLVAGVAHELNNPLTGISMGASLIKKNLEKLGADIVAPDGEKEAGGSARPTGALDKALREAERIVSACEKAGALVSGLLSYARPSQLVLTPVPLHTLIRETVNALKSHPQFTHFTIRLEEGTEEQVACDRVKLEQVFYNLLKNACEATDGRGTVRISYSGSTDGAGRHFIRAHVRDNGPGIDKTVINRIFDPFFTTKGHNGVGLGLSISYRTVEQHGGLLSVESVPGEGAEYLVSLPVYCPPPEEDAQTPTASPDTAKPEPESP